MTVFRWIVVVITLNNFNLSRGLATLPAVEENDIVKTEAAIRNTTNELFAIFNLRTSHNLSTIKQYSSIYKYFISLTLQDYDSLNEIAKLTRVDKNKTENGNTDYIAILNDILDEENVNQIQNVLYGEVEGSYNIDDQLSTIQYLKRFYKHPNKVPDINEQILKLLEESEVENASSATEIPLINLDKDTILYRDGYWRPDNASSKSRRIFGGHSTKIEHYPFLASVQFFGRFQCGSSIIKSDLTITVASCLQLAWNNRFYRENPAFLTIRVGSSFFESGGESIPIMEIYFYPTYDPRSLNNNLAIMRMVRHVFWNKRVRRIQMDTNDKELPTTVGVTVVGWGAKTRSNVLQSPVRNRIHYSVLTVYPLDECQEIYSSKYVTDKHFCAGMLTEGSGACNKDVGGPGLVDGYLVGVISFGAPVCGTPDAPTVFTKLGYYTDWIEEILEQEAPHSKKRTTTTETPELYRSLFNSTTSVASTVASLNPVAYWEHSTSAPLVTMFDATINTKATPKPYMYSTKEVSRSRDTKLFKQFLKTMFTSQEILEYVDSMKESNPKVTHVPRMPLPVPPAVKIQKPAPIIRQPNPAKASTTVTVQYTRNPFPTESAKKLKIDEPHVTKIIDFDNPPLKSSDEYMSIEVSGKTAMDMKKTTKYDTTDRDITDEITTSNVRDAIATAGIPIRPDDSAQEKSLELSKANDDFTSNQIMDYNVGNSNLDKELGGLFDFVKISKAPPQPEPVTDGPLRNKYTKNILFQADLSPSKKGLREHTVQYTLDLKKDEQWDPDSETSSSSDEESDALEISVPGRTTALQISDDMPAPITSQVLKQTKKMKKKKLKKKNSLPKEQSSRPKYTVHVETDQAITSKTLQFLKYIPDEIFANMSITPFIVPTENNLPLKLEHLKQLRFKKLHRQSQELSQFERPVSYPSKLKKHHKATTHKTQTQIGRQGLDIDINNEKKVDTIREYYRELLKSYGNSVLQDEVTAPTTTGPEIPTRQIPWLIQPSLAEIVVTPKQPFIQILGNEQNYPIAVQNTQIPESFNPAQSQFQVQQFASVSKNKDVILSTPIFSENKNEAILENLGLVKDNKKVVQKTATKDDSSEETYFSNYELIVQKPLRKLFGKKVFFLDLAD